MSRRRLLGRFVALALLSALATGVSAQAAATRICENNTGSICGTTYPVGSTFVGNGVGSITLPGVTGCAGSTLDLEIIATGPGAESTEITFIAGTSCSGVA